MQALIDKIYYMILISCTLPENFDRRFLFNGKIYQVVVENGNIIKII